MSNYVEIIFTAPVDPAFSEAFTLAADFWNTAIVSSPVGPLVFNQPFNIQGDCGVSFTLPGGTTIAGLAVVSSIEPIDGAGSILGSAGPCIFDGIVPKLGIMRFDVADVQNLVAQGNWEEVIRHEMAHVIGIGTVWQRSGFLNNPCGFFSFFGCNPTYNRPEGIAAYEQLGGSGPVPVANTGGQGTQNGHWREVTFENELMTGFLNSGVVNPASILTIRSLRDIGYTVDLGAAEPYSLPKPGFISTGEKLSFGEDILMIEPVDVKEVMERIAAEELAAERKFELTLLVAGLIALVSALAAAAVFVAYKRRARKTEESDEVANDMA